LNQLSSKRDECFIVVKARPHRSSNYFETVCCAGIGRDGKWRRQYPVPFRILADDQKFGRWSWISYEFTKSKNDRRTESQKVIPESLMVGDKVNKGERTNLLNSLVRESFAEADNKGESLTLLRPVDLELRGTKKSVSEVDAERQKHIELSRQMSFLDTTARPLEPCPMRFRLHWKDSSGKRRDHDCDDWETSAAYSRFESAHGSEEALRILKEKYEEQYFKAGLALAFSTHSLRNATTGTKNQWLLVGMIRLDFFQQRDLLVG